MELAEDPHDRSGIAILELEEESRPARWQILPDLLHEAAVDARRGGSTDQAAGDRAPDDGSDREDDEQETAEHGTDRGSRLRPTRHLVVEGDLAVGVLAHDRGVLEPDLARVLDRSDRPKRRLGVVSAIKGDRQELSHRL